MVKRGKSAAEGGHNAPTHRAPPDVPKMGKVEKAEGWDGRDLTSDPGFLDAVFENMAEGLIILDEDLKYVLINPAAGRMVGHNPKEWIGKRAGGYVHPDDRMKSSETVLKALQGEPSSCEIRVMGSDGRYRHLKNTYSLLVYKEKIHLLGLIDDVTHSKAAEDALKASEEKYRTFVDNPTVVIYTMDLKGNLLFVNTAFTNQLGYTPAEAQEMNGFGLIHPDDMHSVQKSFEQLVKGNTIHNIEFRALTKCGTYLPFLGNGMPILDVRGKVVAILNIGWDVSDLKKAEGELKKYQEHLEELVHERTKKLMEEVKAHRQDEEELTKQSGRLEYVLGATKTGFDIIDRDYNVIYVNPEWAKSLGDYHGKKCYAYFMGAKKPCQTCAIPKSLETKKKVVSEEFLVKEKRYVEVHTVPFKDESGEWMVAEFNIDVTYRKKAEVELRESERKYRELVDLLSDVIFTLDFDGNIADITPSIHNFLGWTRDEIIGKEFRAFVHPDDMGRTEEEFARGIQGKGKPLEIRLIHKAGSPKWVRVNGLLVMREGEPHNFLGIITDVHERKMVEDELKESEEKYRALFSQASDGIMLAAADLSGGMVNEAFARMHGYASPKEMSGVRLEDLDTPEGTRLAPERLRRMLAGESLRFEVEHRHRDGHTFPVQVSCSVVMIGGKQYFLGFHQDITERKKSEKALRVSEEKYRVLAERVKDVIFTIDLDLNLTYISPSIQALLGYTIEEAMGMGLAGLLAPSSLGRAMELFQANLGEEMENSSLRGTERLLEMEVVSKAGKVIPVEVLVNFIWSPEGELRGGLGVVRDITERMRSLGALRESEEKFRELSEKSPNMIFINKGGRIVYANKRCQDVMGYSREEFYAEGFQVTTLIAPEDRELIAKNLQKHFTGEEIPPNEYRLITKDGRRLDSIINTKLITLQGESAILGIITDTTEMREAQKALRESQNLLARIVETSPDGIAVSDMHGNLTYVSEGALRMVGYQRPEELLGKSMLTFFPPEQQEIVLRDQGETLKKGSQRNLKYSILRKDRTSFHCEINASVIFDAEGKPTGIMGILRDVTDRIKADEAIRESEEKYRNLVEHAHDVILILQDEKIAFANKQVENLFGYNIEEIVGQHFLGFLAKEVRSDLLARYKERISGKTPQQIYESRVLLKNGATVPVEINSSLITYNGKPATLTLLRDLRERKKAEQAIVDSEEKYRNLVERANDGIMVIQGKGPVFVNKKLVDMLGYDLNDMASMSMEHLLSSKELQKVFGKAQTRRDGMEQISIYETSFKAKDGHLVPIEVNASFINFNGAPATMIFVRDLTERKKTEKEMQELKEFSESVIRNSPIGIVTTDTAGNITSVNPSALRILGSPSEEKTKEFNVLKMEQLVKQGISDYFDRCLKNGEKVVAENVRYVSFWGKGSIITLNIVPLVSPEDKRIGSMALIEDITDRRVAERALHESETRLESIMNSMADLIFGFDEDGRFVYYHAPDDSKLWVPPHTFIGMKYDKVMPPNISALIADCITANKKMEPREMEYEMEIGNQKSWFQAKLSPMFLDRKYKGSVAVVRDITERKLAESSIFESELKYRTLFNSAHDAIFLMDGDVFVDCNKKTLEMFRCTREQIIGQRPYKFSPKLQPDGRKSKEKAIMYITEAFDGKPQFFEWKHTHYDGTEFDAEVSLARVEFSGKKYLLAMVRDITKRKEAEHKLKESEEKYRKLMESASDAIFLADSETGILIDANKRALELIGRTKEEVIGMHQTKLHPLEDVERYRAHFRAHVTGVKTDEENLYVVHKDGHKIPVSISPSRFELGGRHVNQGIFHDLTEQKKAQEERIKKRVLEAQFELKSVITDILPAMIESMGSQGKKAFIDKMSEKLDKVLSDRYSEGLGAGKPEDVGRAYINVLTDLGGKESISCPEKGDCLVTVQACPWENQVGRNLTLCILCRGIAWRFAIRTSPSPSVTLQETMADGKPECKILIEKPSKNG